MAVSAVPLSGAVTGLGSLPMKDPAHAIRMIAEASPELPFWPQLPQRDEKETMIRQGMGLLEDLMEPRANGLGFRIQPNHLNTVAHRLESAIGMLDSAHAVGFSAFESAIAGGLFPSAMAVKGQVTGPLSLCTYLYAGEQPFLTSHVLFEAVTEYVARIAQWQIGRLVRRGHRVLLFVDEPALSLHPSAASHDPIPALELIFERIRKSGALAGLHCCARNPFDLMFRAQPDILSFDSHQWLEEFVAMPEFPDFLADGGMVAYGIVPTLGSLEGIRAEDLFDRWVNTISQMEDPRLAAKQAMVTASCGLAMATEEEALASFQIAGGVSKLIRQLAAE